MKPTCEPHPPFTQHGSPNDICHCLIPCPSEVRALARDLTANSATPYDRALAIETYLRTYPYSLAVPAPPLDRGRGRLLPLRFEKRLLQLLCNSNDRIGTRPLTFLPA